MKTAKITKVTGNGSFDSNFGKLYKFEVHFDNGDYGDANCKTADQKTWVEGQTVNYELTPNSNPKFNGKLTLVKDAPVMHSQPQSNPNGLNVQNLIVAQSSLSSAVEFCKNNSLAEDRDVLDTADLFYKWVLTKG
jgi:hypothetical protein